MIKLKYLCFDSSKVTVVGRRFETLNLKHLYWKYQEVLIELQNSLIYK